MSFKVFGISAIYIFGFLVLALVFVVFPELDLWTAGLFADPDHLFTQANTPVVNVIYKSVEVLTIILAVVLLALLAATLLKKRPVFKLTSKQVAYLILALILGPGLVVNLFAKNMMGRARPAHIEQFGGDQVFTPAFVLSDQCERNCSFVSGHAALGFYLISFSYVLGRHRRKVFAAACVYGTIVGIVRMYQGGHFLSDVVFAFCFVYFVSRMLYHIMFERNHAASS